MITKLYPNQFSAPEAYHAMEKVVADGKIRSLGLSNWYVKELEKIFTADKHYARSGSE